MVSDGDFYKREEDRKWRESVEARLVNLVSAQKSTDDQLDEQDLEIVGLKETVNGDPKDRDGGLIGQVNTLETSLNSIQRVLQPDAAGNAGLVAQFREVKQKVLGKEKEQEYRWNFLNSATVAIASILVALISIAGLLITNWDKVSEFLNRKGKTDPVEQMIENARHPKPRRRHIVRVKPVPDDEENP